MANSEAGDVAALVNPILNSPYEEPSRHLVIGPKGPTGEIKGGRRPSESYVPVVPTRKGQAQLAIDFDATGERIESNELINSIRHAVSLWRSRNYQGVTPVTRKLLLYWANEERENRMLFCQREAAETAIFLGECDKRDFRPGIDQLNLRYNEGLPRLALKMATGTGKTVVLGMLIAWQTINKVRAPHDRRFAKRFLVVAPGITIRDRLRVLRPSDDENYYKMRDLVPVDLWGDLQQAQIAITNYHAFMPKVTKEAEGVAAAVKNVLRKKGQPDPFIETPSQVVTRVLKDLGPDTKEPIVVLNDEAHHCYIDKAADVGDGAVKADGEDKSRNEDARVWFRGLQWVMKYRNLKSVYDLSATPYYLKGSGYYEGFIFPWTVSDFSLIEAIECGIVKIPRLPVDDDTIIDDVIYRTLWDHIGDKLPKKVGNTDASSWVMPVELEGALRSLYRSYEKSFNHWHENLRRFGEAPPVMIVVCNNTIVSRLVYDWIAGRVLPKDDGTYSYKPGNLPILSNSDANDLMLARPHTILIDSAELESGDVLSKDFKEAASLEIERFKEEFLRRTPGADPDKISESDLLREVMNTVGKKGQLGEHIRCVVSVSMLTEGWDANNVSHILGIRAFKSQLLCEQVVGRGLRRRNYEVNEDGKFDPEYAEVYGVPFSIIPADADVPAPKPKSPQTDVRALSDRSHLEITFPKLDGYRIEIPEQKLAWQFGEHTKYALSSERVANWVRVEGVLGEKMDVHIDLERLRAQTVAYQLASHLLATKFVGLDADKDKKPWLFPQVLQMCKEWIASQVVYGPNTNVGHLTITEFRAEACERIYDSVIGADDEEVQILLPIIRRFDPDGTTADVNFPTRKPVMDTTKSHVNYVVLDGKQDNTWERAMAEALEVNQDVFSYVKNDHLGFAVPYVLNGKSFDYLPDYLVRLKPADDGIERTLIVEVSGTHKPKAPTAAKALTARNRWCRAVNNAGSYGLWGYLEVHAPGDDAYKAALAQAIKDLYQREPKILGQTDEEN
jgi:type III restriction enzyme